MWCLSWCPAPEDGEILALGCWDQTLSFYLLSGDQYIKDRELGFNPCSISYLNGGSYIAIGGSNRKATLCTKVGDYVVRSRRTLQSFGSYYVQDNAQIFIDPLPNTAHHIAQRHSALCAGVRRENMPFQVLFFPEVFPRSD